MKTLNTLDDDRARDSKAKPLAHICAALAGVSLLILLHFMVGTAFLDEIPDDGKLGHLVHEAFFYGFFVFSYSPAVLLFDLGYRGSLIGWGDGWAWLSLGGLLTVYGLPCMVFAWIGRRSLLDVGRKIRLSYRRRFPPPT